ncbi:MAG: hypothetical protein A3I05_00720 [Deltaproteobacteria bacterium RIFCSPLOWO2_02_FULL_44_10]|nr:MAG: hypothetical protein A3I05_00720 [Deltaproteobacteria bacterium RIFCSPLOWO2_02_FULL_44_10]
MPIHPKISPRIISSIATLYNDVNRVFMEYIDNAIDSADQYWFDNLKNSYTRPIEVKIQVSGKNPKDASVTISDNCYGITNFGKVVESIGDSDKKNNRFTNGQFGFGIYSFMAACTNLELTSKESGKDALYLELNREQFDRKSVEEVKIPDPKTIKKFPHTSGTVVRLSGFDKNAWKSIESRILKEEIEKHFELILRRENLVVKIIDSDNGVLVCAPFDYDAFEGEVYEDHIAHFDIESGRKNKVKETIRLENPISIYLKMTKGVVLNKPPVFISKGRRIGEIKDVKSFKSQHKSDIWGHASVTGYIDLKDFLGPTLARNDFKSDKNSRSLFQGLLELESLILDYVKRANAQTDEKHYQQLEDALNKALSKLARVDAMNFRTAFLKGGDANLSGGSIGNRFADEGGMKDFGDGEIENPGEGIGEGEGEGLGPKEDGSDLPGGKTEGDQAKNEEQFADSEFKGKERKKSGFNIHISDAEPQVDAETGKQLRSILSGNEIVIFKKHSDFQARLSHTRQGESKITDRLLGYIAGEITVHYKDEFYNKRQSGQPEYNKNMFVGMAEFIYQLEDALSILSGKNLSEL